MDLRRPLVSIVDDDESVRESLPDLLKEFGYRVDVFSSAESFLEAGGQITANCMILDVAMPGMTGPDLQRELIRRNQLVPIIFITAHRDEAVRRRLMQDGAVACLYKPFSDAALQDALGVALKPA